MKIDNLDKLLVHELKDLYSAEKQFCAALPKMAKAASNATLSDAFTSHCEETKGHVARLERVFEWLEGKPNGARCDAAEGLVKEGAGIIKDIPKGALRDAALIGAGQRVEHYEIAGYGTAVALAEKLGKKEVAAELKATLNEEGSADKHLTKVASTVNSEALSASSS